MNQTLEKSANKFLTILKKHKSLHDAVFTFTVNSENRMIIKLGDPVSVHKYNSRLKKR